MHNTVNTEKKLSKMTTSALIYNTLTLSFPLCMVLGHTDIFLFHSVLANTAVLIPLTFTQKMNSSQPKTTVFFLQFHIFSAYKLTVHHTLTAEKNKMPSVVTSFSFSSFHGTNRHNILFL